ncbi:MAG: tyrosine--tRNA ligase [Bacteroidota bacterium]|nr:tyrosine--tRNA ligase [Bacteroidota bacterium]
MSFIDELSWRGMVHNVMPGVEEELRKGVATAYIGFDPTADSLHIGSLVQIMTLVHFQKSGHKPLALIGGATGLVGDPSGKSKERNLLSKETLDANIKGITKQLEQFLDFDCGTNSAEVVNNYDWFDDFSFLGFIRDVGKHITINYMLSKDSVKSRMETGMSFTEFTYQLVQGYDFYWLYKNKNCKFQLGGSDQWGNIVTGTELIRRKDSGDAFAITTPLIQKADGTKFGKTEEGNVWLDPKRTSPYKFYQYWINSSDLDAQKYIKIFTLLSKDKIHQLIDEHMENPSLRILQKELAKQVTILVHGENHFQLVKNASEILFQKGKTAIEGLKNMDESLFLEVFEGVPQAEINADLIGSLKIVDALSSASNFLKSNGEARRALKENSISLNKEKVNEDKIISKTDLIGASYILLQRGKRNYFILKVV